MLGAPLDPHLVTCVIAHVGSRSELPSGAPKTSSTHHVTPPQVSPAQKREAGYDYANTEVLARVGFRQTIGSLMTSRNRNGKPDRRKTRTGAKKPGAPNSFMSDIVIFISPKNIMMLKIDMRPIKSLQSSIDLEAQKCLESGFTGL